MWNPFETRIAFHPELDVMEVDFGDIIFADADFVDAAYDELERQLDETGRKWFFLIRYENCRIDPAAWSAFAARGKKLNLAYSLGSVRFGARADTKDEIQTASKVERFDANLVGTREAALARIAELRGAGGEAAQTAPCAVKPDPEMARRIAFDHEHEVMEADFSDLVFIDAAMVNRIYDELERQIVATGRKWFFLVNYRNCRIFPEAWFAFAQRGKRLNLGYSLGSVRFDTSLDISAEIARKADAEEFDHNLCHTREAAIQRIEELRGHA